MGGHEKLTGVLRISGRLLALALGSLLLFQIVFRFYHLSHPRISFLLKTLFIY